MFMTWFRATTSFMGLRVKFGFRAHYDIFLVNYQYAEMVAYWSPFVRFYIIKLNPSNQLPIFKLTMVPVKNNDSNAACRDKGAIQKGMLAENLERKKGEERHLF